MAVTGTEASRRRDWLHLGFTMLVVQAIYWLVLGPAFAPVERALDRVVPTRAEVATLASPDWAAVEAAQFGATEMPWEDCCEEGYRAVRITFTLDEVPPTGLGDVPVIGADNYTAYINGSQYYSEGRMMLPDISYHGRAYRGINRLPAGLLREGENQIVYVMASAAATGGFFVASPNLGEYDAVIGKFAFRRFLLNDYLVISATIGALVSLLALVAWARGGRQPYLFWLAVLAGSWAFMNTQFSLTDPWLKGRTFVILTVAGSLLIPTAWINLANNWATNDISRRIPYVLPVTLVLWAAGVAVFDLTNVGTGDTELAMTLARTHGGLAALATMVLLLRKVPGVERGQHWELSFFLLCATMLVRDAISEFTDGYFGTQTDYALPFLFVGLIAAFLGRNIRLFRSTAEINALLQGQLDQRTTELATAHAREKVLLREQAHQDERRRIMADMHDGLGSQLMSMLLSARRGKAQPDDMARGLQAAIDEMRLMIDSMDSVGESLASALALFRERAQDRVTAAGFAFEWHDESGGDLPTLPPRAVLQVFRVLQETVTNALKHSNGNAIGVNVAAQEILVCDNGSVLGDVRPGGRGLENMAARASAIGGAFALSREGDLTVARISLPDGKDGETGHG